MDNDRVPIRLVLDEYESYLHLLKAIGFRVNKAAIRRHCISGLGYSGPMKAFFNRVHAQKHPNHTAPKDVYDRIATLRRGLEAIILREIAPWLRGKSISTVADGTLAGVLMAVPDEARERVSCAARAEEHGRFVGRREMTVKEFQRRLGEYCSGQTVCRRKLILRIQEVLAANGISMSFDTIEERFRNNTKVKTMPACVLQAFENKPEDFLTGLVPIESLTGSVQPGEWLERKRAALMFRSDSAMHKALAEASGLNYDSVHKALSGPRKAQRIQVKICECFDKWQKQRAEGQPLSVDPKYRGVPVEEFRQILERLRTKFQSDEIMYKELGARLGVNPQQAKRFHEGKVSTKHLPIEYYGRVMALMQDRPDEQRSPSYLKDMRVRDLAGQLAQEANRSLEAAQLKQNGARAAMVGQYRNLRLRLITVLKEQRHQAGIGMAG
ncbi:MAG TPA: hypothetical protein PL033_01865 [Candidatus Brocadiia bacterium]|nr:hypothetical protein [Candidatus Brocadiia bacterium]